MKISVMSYSFSRAMSQATISAAEAVAFCAQAGAQGIEPNDGLALALGDDELRRLLAAHRLTVPCYDVSVNLIQEPAVARDAAASALAQAVRRAASFGAPLVLVVPGAVGEGISFERACAWTAQGLREALAVATELGMVLTVEQMGSARALCHRGEHLRALVQAVDSPHFGLTYDAGNFLLTGEDCARPLAELAPWVRHVHFKDWKRDANGAWTGVALGQGAVPLGAIYDTLRAAGYEGYISVEYEGPHDPRAAVRTGIEYLRHLERACD